MCPDIIVVLGVRDEIHYKRNECDHDYEKTHMQVFQNVREFWFREQLREHIAQADANRDEDYKADESQHRKLGKKRVNHAQKLRACMVFHRLSCGLKQH